MIDASAAILVGVGANLPAVGHADALATCRAAVTDLSACGLRVDALSPWYESAPVPASDQPWFVNGVVSVATDLDPPALLDLLHAVEAAFGRVRSVPNAARVLDLDLLAYGRLVVPPPARPALPHPRLTKRAFVLLPLADLLPDWRHPADGRSVGELIGALPPEQAIRWLTAPGERA